MHFFLPLNGMYMFILPLTLKECLFVVLYETVIALALILIDGAVAHLLKAAYIYLPGLYMCTNSNCFTPLSLGSCQENCERVRSIILMSQHRHALNHSAHNKTTERTRV